MRKYGVWINGKGGRLEDLTRCIAIVGGQPHQCSNPRGHGIGRNFCKQHFSMIEEGKRVPVPTTYGGL